MEWWGKGSYPSIKAGITTVYGTVSKCHQVWFGDRSRLWRFALFFRWLHATPAAGVHDPYPNDNDPRIDNDEGVMR